MAFLGLRAELAGSFGLDFSERNVSIIKPGSSGVPDFEVLVIRDLKRRAAK